MAVTEWVIDTSPEDEALSITADLVTGAVFDLPYGLDLAGILASRVRLLDMQARAADYDGRVPVMPDTTEEEAEDLLLPLARCRTGEDWHWAATCAIPSEADPDLDPRTYYRSTDYGWAQRAATRPLPYYLSPSKGPYRDSMMPAPAVICGQLQWRAIGDAAAVSRLLRPIRSIGKRRATGEGGITKWTVEPVEVDAATWVHLDGSTILRPCPEACVAAAGLDEEQWRTGHYAIRPPSWHPSRLQPLAMTQFEDDFEEW